MDNLRWILLIIGLLIIASIYLWDLYRHKRTPKRGTEVIFNNDPSPLDQINPQDEEGQDDYLDELNSLNQSRMRSGAEKMFDFEDEDTTIVPSELKISEIDDEQLKPQDVERENHSEDHSAGADDLIYLQIIAPEGEVFRGMQLLIATKNVEMKFGGMNIFHHYGVGQMNSDKPLFSLANLFEPGEFKLEEMDSFSTKGLVVYMSLPGPLETDMSFELMLNTCQRIAEQLNGEIRDSNNQPLTDESIQSMREKIHRFGI